MKTPWPGLVVEGEIGYGSYGTVYEVSLAGNKYAMKLIPLADDFCKQDGKLEEELFAEIRFLQRFRNHPNIVSIQDYQIMPTEEGPQLFILMELLTPLTEYETIHVMREQDAIRMGIDLCSALESCEENNVLHRDLKIDNVLVTEDGRFKLCDFSDAKLLEKSIIQGSVKGTFSFMAPEVYHGRKYDHRADLYSLGMILYRMVNRGREPFLPIDQGMPGYRAREDALNRRMDGEPLPAPADASDELTQILFKACAYYPEKRYPNAKALKEELRNLEKKECAASRISESSEKISRLADHYGKRTKAFYRKVTFAALLFLAVIVLAGKTAYSFYLERYVNYCDPEIVERLEEEYGIQSTARLNGNGVLIIEKNEDLYCSVRDGVYPWINQKDRIRKVIFGENVTSFRALYEGFGYDDIRSDPYPFSPVSSDSLRYCKNLKEIQIRSHYFQMDGNLPLQGDPNISVIECPKDCEFQMGNIGGLLFSETLWYRAGEVLILGDCLIKYSSQKSRVEDIPENVTMIADHAFIENHGIRTVSLPSGLKRIGSQAFQDCLNLEQIDLPTGLTQIDAAAFYGCKNLTHITLPASVEYMEGSVFIGCHSLTDLSVSTDNPFYKVEDGALWDIRDNCLLWCSDEAGKHQLNNGKVHYSLEIPAAIKGIASVAFYDCEKLEELTLPDLTSTNPTNLFGRCPSLNTVHISDANHVFRSDGPLIYDKIGELLVLCERDTVGEVAVTEGTLAINEYAFACCKDLTQIKLPETLQFIGIYAFEDCTGLKSIILPASLTRIATNAFLGCTNLTDIYYEGTREEWEAMTDRFELGIDEKRTTIRTK